MSILNSDKNKQAIKVCFSRRHDKSYPQLIFSSTSVELVFSWKHLGFIGDSKRDFNEYIDNKIKCNKIITLIKKLSLDLITIMQTKYMTNQKED